MSNKAAATQSTPIATNRILVFMISILSNKFSMFHPAVGTIVAGHRHFAGT